MMAQKFALVQLMILIQWALTMFFANFVSFVIKEKKITIKKYIRFISADIRMNTTQYMVKNYTRVK